MSHLSDLRFLLLCTTLALPLMAQENPNPVTKILERLDTDGDSLVSATEFAHGKLPARIFRKMTPKEVFARLDRDGDQSLDPTELEVLATYLIKPKRKRIPGESLGLAELQITRNLIFQNLLNAVLDIIHPP